MRATRTVTHQMTNRANQNMKNRTTSRVLNFYASLNEFIGTDKRQEKRAKQKKSRNIILRFGVQFSHLIISKNWSVRIKWFWLYRLPVVCQVIVATRNRCIRHFFFSFRMFYLFSTHFRCPWCRTRHSSSSLPSSSSSSFSSTSCSSDIYLSLSLLFIHFVFCFTFSWCHV